MFGKKNSEKSAPSFNGSTAADAQKTSEPVNASSQERHPQDKKGVPTPTRKEREAARRRPLIVSDPAEAKRQRREARAAEAAKVRESFKTGDERYLPLKHRGANRKMIRSVVDERFRFSELLMFLLLPLLFLSIVFATNLEVQRIVSYIFYAMFLIFIIESILITRKVRRIQAERNIPRQPGDVFYILERTMMFSKFRMPAPGI